MQDQSLTGSLGMDARAALGCQSFKMDPRQGTLKKVTVLFLSSDPSTSAGWRTVTPA